MFSGRKILLIIKWKYHVSWFLNVVVAIWLFLRNERLFIALFFLIFDYSLLPYSVTMCQFIYYQHYCFRFNYLCFSSNIHYTISLWDMYALNYFLYRLLLKPAGEIFYLFFHAYNRKDNWIEWRNYMQDDFLIN